MIIGLVGYKGSGKSTISRAAIGTSEGWEIISFAEPINKMLVAFGVPEIVLRDKSRWDEPREELCGQTIRHAAQTLGTEWGRKCINEKLWTNRGLTKAKEANEHGWHSIIENIRFPSEFEELEAIGGITIAMYREKVAPVENTYLHESERYICSLRPLCAHKFYNELPFDQSARLFAQLLQEVLDLHNKSSIV